MHICVCPVVSLHGSARFFFHPTTFSGEIHGLPLNQPGFLQIDVCSDSTGNHEFSWGKQWGKRGMPLRSVTRNHGTDRRNCGTNGSLDEPTEEEEAAAATQ